MAAPFAPPKNSINKVTPFTAIRVGPEYNEGMSASPINSAPQFNGIRAQGLSPSPICTYRFTPYAPTAGNIVSVSDPGMPNGQQWLPLSGDNLSSTLVAANSPVTFGKVIPPNTPLNPGADPKYIPNAGQTVPFTPVWPVGNLPNPGQYLQFDVPRVPRVVLTGAGLPGGGGQVYLYGFDLYRRPITQVYTIGAGEACSIPRALYGETSAGGTVLTPAKAFYGITAVYADFAVEAGATLAVQTSNIFGLPYTLRNWGDVIEYTIGGLSYKSIQAAAPSVAMGGGGFGATFTHPALGNVTVGAAVIGSQNYISPVPVISTYFNNAVAGAVNYTVTDVNKPTATAQGNLVVTGTANAVAGQTITLSMADGGSGLCRPGDYTVQTDFTPSSWDPRGLIQTADLDETFTSQSVNAFGQGVPIEFTYYVYGADYNISVLAAGFQPEGFLPVAGVVPPPPANTPAQVPQLVEADLVGVTPYFNGTAV